MEVEQFEWKEFKMEKLHEQIQAGCVSIGFRKGNLTVRIHGRPGEVEGRPQHWKIFAVFCEDGKPDRTMSRILAPDQVTLELERSVNTARSMMASRPEPS
jgi:hypothetical protein